MISRRPYTGCTVPMIPPRIRTCLNCWEQMDRLANNFLQQAGTIVTTPFLRNWRSQARKQCKWGTMILTEALLSARCANISKNPNLPKLLGTNGPTGKQFLATSRNDCHHIVSEELEIPSAKTVQAGYYDPHGGLTQRALCR